MDLEFEDKLNAYDKLCTNVEQVFKEKINKIYTWFKEEELEEAIEYLENEEKKEDIYIILIKEYEKNFEALINNKNLMMYLAKITMERGEYYKAIDIYFDLVIKFDDEKHDITWREEEALANVKVGNILEAHRIFSKLEDNYPNYKRPKVKADKIKVKNEIKLYKFDFL